MDNPNQMGILFVAAIAMVLVAIVRLIARRDAKPGVIGVLILLPFLAVLGFYYFEGGSTGELENISSALVIGVIASIIGGLILFGIKK